MVCYYSSLSGGNCVCGLFSHKDDKKQIWLWGEKHPPKIKLISLPDVGALCFFVSLFLSEKYYSFWLYWNFYLLPAFFFQSSWKVSLLLCRFPLLWVLLHNCCVSFVMCTYYMTFFSEERERWGSKKWVKSRIYWNISFTLLHKACCRFLFITLV